MALNIVYEDKKIIIIFKEAGQLSQSGKNFDVDLTSEVLNYRKKNKEDTYAAIINRLDRNVSGLVLFAKTRQEAARLTKEMSNKGFNKQYYAIVCGKPKEEKGTFVDYLVKDEKNNMSCITDSDNPDGKRAELRYEVVKTVEAYVNGETKMFTLVKIDLITGRLHQIRIQFASRGLALVGDTKYASVFVKNSEADMNEVKSALQDYGLRLKSKEIALCAYSLEIDKHVYEINPKWIHKI